MLIVAWKKLGTQKEAEEADHAYYIKWPYTYGKGWGLVSVFPGWLEYTEDGEHFVSEELPGKRDSTFMR